jgi:putative DNA primase/helicase
VTILTATPTTTYTNGAPPTANGAPPHTATFDLLKYRAEDGGILDCWHDLYAEQWMYTTGYECWFGWTGTHWAKNECQGIQHQIEKLMDAMNRAAKTELANAIEDGDKEAVKIFTAYVGATKRTRARVASVEGMAQARCAVAAGALDAGNVLNLRNGTLDLDTVTVRPHDRCDRLTYCLDYDYDPAALCPRFEQFVQEVLVNEEPDANGKWVTDVELCSLIQSAMGYSLTNDTKHEVMFWLSGGGGNGKSVLIKTIQALLGINAFSLNFANLGTTDGNYRLAKLVGKRVVFCTESQRNGGIAEDLMKQIADGSDIDARPIRGEPFNFRSQAKIWWALNDRPVIKDTGNAIWRRLKLIPFNRTFDDANKDVNLFATLMSELPGILNFALDGLRQLRGWGIFPEAKAVLAAVQEYKHESNAVAQWLDERTVKLATPVTLSSALYADYKLWSDENGRQAFNATNFGKELKRLQIVFKSNTRSVDGRVGNCYALGLLVTRAEAEAATKSVVGSPPANDAEAVTLGL